MYKNCLFCRRFYC